MKQLEIKRKVPVVTFLFFYFFLSPDSIKGDFKFIMDVKEASLRKHPHSEDLKMSGIMSFGFRQRDLVSQGVAWQADET